MLGHEGAIVALLPAHRGVGVQAEDQEVALLAGELQQVGVAVVEDVEAAIGEDDLAAGLLDLSGLLPGDGHVDDLRRPRRDRRAPRLGQQVIERDGAHAELPNHGAARQVGQRTGIDQVEAAGQRDGQGRGHRVAGPGHVVDGHRDGRHVDMFEVGSRRGGGTG